ncbi:MTH938/NDUFAF3 family protein [Sphingomonas sp. BIUV-7]|uniref:MTH938/NDUFAF3 family protein n=1 Tax=Sphingomonas natans TaxID=3063330 RepID=A0ABT8Y599_9SPHN|nr:MTH938/NDUFAF3 family protein [Sphingomonas sp. BIUV-7]MDO6413507.1 MTH938/NDUFAF3 family protein [Sphingomonas sp. BIUV-7]
MSKLDQTPAAIGPLVAAVGPSGFRVGDRMVPGGLILTPDDALDWEAGSFDALAEADFAPLLVLKPLPEFVLLGTGATLRRPAPALTAALEAKGLFLEPMDSRAAARTWGLLRAEGRNIAAALLPIA